MQLSSLRLIIPTIREEERIPGAELRLLPPYSPDYGPTELAFSKLKALLRKAAGRTAECLWDAV